MAGGIMHQLVFPFYHTPALSTHAARVLLTKAVQESFPCFLERSFLTVNPGVEFLPNWHLGLIAEYLAACARGEITRLLINMPPRSLKSLSVSVAWPAWLLAQNPARRIMVASYASHLALKHSLDTRLIMQSPWYNHAFARTRLTRDQNEKHKFTTTARGYRIATSVGGVVTGEGGDVLIVDDPLNAVCAMSTAARGAANSWFDHSFSTRLDDKKKGVMVVVMQRLHEEDLTGHLRAKGGWEELVLPALARTEMLYQRGNFSHIRPAGAALHEARENETLIARAKKELGTSAFAAQYQQDPLPEEGGMVKECWLKRYDSLPEGTVVQSWDTGIKAGASHDPSACATFVEADGVYYLAHMLTGRLEYPELRRTVLEHAERFKPDVILIEDKASGQSLLQDMRRETRFLWVAVKPRGDKCMRLAATTPLLEAGKVLLPRHAPWLAELETELLRFPGSKHDDQVDAISQYLHWARGREVAWRMRRV